MSSLFVWISLLTLAGMTAALAAEANEREKPDWLVTPIQAPAAVTPMPERKEITLSNGLVRRVFRVAPNLATIDLTNLITGASVLRGVKPEAVVVLDGQRVEIGGLKGQPDYAYLDPSWLDKMTGSPEAFQYVGYRVGKPEARYPWKPKRHAPEVPWPPKGVTLTFDFQPPESLKARYGGLVVSVHYALYNGLPALAKWITIANGGSKAVEIGQVETEILAVTEQEKHRLHVESNYAFYIAGTGPPALNVTSWGPDKDYTSQVDYDLQMPLLLTCKYPLGPGATLQPGETFESFQTYELLYDSDSLERRGMARRRFYRALAPQVTENPIFMHIRNSDPAAARLAIDQCAEVGFEMVILTFWSGFDIENLDPKYVAQIKELVDYARGKGIEFGGYTLMCASRDVGAENNCIDPKTGKPGSKFGQSACLASAWADGYFERVLRFMDATGIKVIETDGPFHGDVCASTKHAHHHGLADSQWRQWQACCDFYKKCQERGIYVNTPDWYYLNGSNKCAMGYRETNFSLPRPQQILIARQNIYDGTFEKTPSMGWMFVPLVEYHGGGAAATLEPLSEHLAEYEWHLAQNFGSGVQAAYRGPRLYDTEATKAVVKKWVDFYKRYRPLLTSDIVHVRRPDGKDLDCMLHVNSQLKERGLAMVYNPTDREIATTLKLPLYYTGLTDKARIREQEGKPKTYRLDREGSAFVPMKLAVKSLTWLVITP